MKVTMIGVSGSGKTSLMSAMYEALGTGEGRAGFHLVPSANDPIEQAKEIEKFEAIAFSNLNMEFPIGTTKTTHWSFDLRYGNRHVTTFNWMDYRGGILTEGSAEVGLTEDKQALLSHILLSDALILVVDSFLLTHYNDLQEVRFRSGARTISTILQSYNYFKPDRDLIFLIALTKCDAVADKWKVQDYQPLVERGLKAFQPIVDICRRNLSWIGGIIPISAVGEGNVIRSIVEPGNLKTPPKAKDEIIHYPKPLNIEHVIFYCLAVTLNQRKKFGLESIKKRQEEIEKVLASSNLARLIWSFITNKPSPQTIAQQLVEDQQADYDALRHFETFIEPLYTIAMEKVRHVR